MNTQKCEKLAYILRKILRNGYLFLAKIICKNGYGVQAEVAHPCPNKIWGIWKFKLCLIFACTAILLCTACHSKLNIFISLNVKLVSLSHTHKVGQISCWHHHVTWTRFISQKYPSLSPKILPVQIHVRFSQFSEVCFTAHQKFVYDYVYKCILFTSSCLKEKPLYLLAIFFLFYTKKCNLFSCFLVWLVKRM